MWVLKTHVYRRFKKNVHPGAVVLTRCHVSQEFISVIAGILSHWHGYNVWNINVINLHFLFLCPLLEKRWCGAENGFAR